MALDTHTIAASPWTKIGGVEARVLLREDDEFYLVSFKERDGTEDCVHRIRRYGPSPKKEAVMWFIRETMRLFDIDKRDIKA
jgi:hypothetical protein